MASISIQSIFELNKTEHFVANQEGKNWNWGPLMSTLARWCSHLEMIRNYKKLSHYITLHYITFPAMDSLEWLEIPCVFVVVWNPPNRLTGCWSCRGVAWDYNFLLIFSVGDTPTLQHSNTPTLQHSNTPTLQHSPGLTCQLLPTNWLPLWLTELQLEIFNSNTNWSPGTALLCLCLWAEAQRVFSSAQLDTFYQFCWVGVEIFLLIWEWGVKSEDKQRVLGN